MVFQFFVGALFRTELGSLSRSKKVRLLTTLPEEVTQVRFNDPRTYLHSILCIYLLARSCFVSSQDSNPAIPFAARILLDHPKIPHNLASQ